MLLEKLEKTKAHRVCRLSHEETQLSKRYLSLIQILYKENVKKYFHMLKAIMLHK